MRKFLQIADFSHLGLQETFNKVQTDRQVRSHVGLDEMDISPEVVKMSEVDVFTTTRGLRKDLGVATWSTDNDGWESRHVTAFCVGLCKYTRPSRLSSLPNAARDAAAFKKKVDDMPNFKAELLENVESEKEFRKAVKKILTRL